MLLLSPMSLNAVPSSRRCAMRMRKCLPRESSPIQSSPIFKLGLRWGLLIRVWLMSYRPLERSTSTKVVNSGPFNRLQILSHLPYTTNRGHSIRSIDLFLLSKKRLVFNPLGMRIATHG